MGALGKWAALGWHLMPVQCDDSGEVSHLRIPFDGLNDSELLQWFFVTTALSTDELACGYNGVPTRVSPPICNPDEVKDHGLILEVIGPQEPMLTYAIRHGVQLYGYEYKKLAQALNIKKPKGTKTRKSLWHELLVRQLFPDASKEWVTNLVAAPQGDSQEIMLTLDTLTLVLDTLCLMSEVNFLFGSSFCHCICIMRQELDIVAF